MTENPFHGMWEFLLTLQQILAQMLKTPNSGLLSVTGLTQRRKFLRRRHHANAANSKVE